MEIAWIDDIRRRSVVWENSLEDGWPGVREACKDIGVVHDLSDAKGGCGSGVLTAGG